MAFSFNREQPIIIQSKGTPKRFQLGHQNTELDICDTDMWCNGSKIGILICLQTHPRNTVENVSVDLVFFFSFNNLILRPLDSSD